MIKLSTKGRYGVRLMLNLASHYQEGNKAVNLKAISSEEDISIRYLEQIIIPLRINRLVKSIRGAGGGYSLARPPSEISVYEIIKALEGPIALVDCVDDEDYCGRIPICATYEIWKEASFLIRDYFKKKTLADLVEIADRKKTTSKISHRFKS
jgi:Rrf2 family protein